MSKEGTRQDRWELLGRALWILRDVLEARVRKAIPEVDSGVHARLQERKGSTETDLSDVKALLNCLAHSPLLRKHLFGSESTCFDEINLLVEMRNYWAHTRPISKEDFAKALTSAGSVLESLGEIEPVQAIRTLQTNLPPSVREARMDRQQRELDAREQRQRESRETQDSASAQGLGDLEQQREQLQEDVREARAELVLVEERLEQQASDLRLLQSQLERQHQERVLFTNDGEILVRAEELEEWEAALRERSEQLDEQEADAFAREVDGVAMRTSPRAAAPSADYGKCLRTDCTGVQVQRYRGYDNHPFLGCSRFPSCGFARAMPFEDEPDHGSCPRCNGQLVRRDSSEGGFFLGCANSHACRYAIEYRDPVLPSRDGA